MRSREGSEPPARPGWSDERVDAVISTLLRAGLVASAALVLAGAVLYLTRHGGEGAAYHVFRGEPPGFREIKGIVEATSRFRGRGFIMAGLILLIATPIARVAFSVVAFLRQRDHVYMIVTLIVLVVLLFSVFWLGLR
jgi:uncharacterized membrane protein